MSHADLVRELFRCYVEQDRPAVEKLIADDLRFTSPIDDHIDREAWLERCFPTADRVAWQELRDVVEADDETVLVRYDYELRTGEHHRNAEAITVRDGLVSEIEVYFGGRVEA